MLMRFSGLKRWTMLTGLLVSTLFCINAVDAAGLNDTGITTCSNADTNGLPCPVADFPGQDAEFGTNGFDFTKLDADGNDLPATATNHTCVRDNLTRLIWQVKVGSSTYRTADYVANINANGLCGFNDWRMPDVKELFGIVDHGIAYPGPTIDNNYLPITPSKNSRFWSGSSYSDDSGSAWYVDFNFGSIGNDDRYNYHNVRLVRGGQSVNSFVDNGDGTVTQSNSGLMWAKCSAGQTDISCLRGTPTAMNWSTALTAANDSRLGGYNDWRLPNIKELQALVDYNHDSPAIDTSYFPTAPSKWFWSSSPTATPYYATPYASPIWHFAEVVSFGDGVANGFSRGSGGHVRLVRGGQSFDPLVLTVAKTGSGAGVVKSSDGKINCGSTCSSDFESGAVVKLTATSDTGSTFGGWTGVCTNKTGDCTVKMSDAQTVTATFTVLPSYSIAVSKVGNGTVTSLPAGISCGTACSKQFSSVTAVTLTATPASGYSFGKWTGCTPIATKPLQCTVMLTSNHTVTAVFGTADIKVTAIALTPASPAANGTFSAKITVKNQGTVTANGGYLDVWVNQPTLQKCGASSDKWIEIGSLAAGAIKTLTVNLPAKSSGTKTLRTFADSSCITSEADEANNQLTKTYTVK